MNTCPNCGKILSEDEKILYKCMSCKQQIKLQHVQYNQYNNISNTKNYLCKFLIGVFTIATVVFLFIYIGSNREYTIAKGDVALEKVNALQSNIWNLNPDIDTTRLDKVVLKRNICIGGIITSIIGGIICCIILYGNKNTPIITKSQNKNYLTQTKLEELEQIYKNNLITQEEYKSKRKEIIDKL